MTANGQIETFKADGAIDRLLSARSARSPIRLSFPEADVTGGRAVLRRLCFRY
jgi:hypothetical protein